MWYSCYVGILVAIFWTYYILRYIVLVNLSFFSLPMSLKCFAKILAFQNHLYHVSTILAVVATLTHSSQF